MTIKNISLSHLGTYVPDTNYSVEEVYSHIANVGIEIDSEEVNYVKNTLNLKVVPVAVEESLQEMIFHACHSSIRQLRSEGKPIDRIIIVRTLQIDFHEENLLESFKEEPYILNIPTFSISQQNCASIHMAFRIIKSMLLHQANIRGVLVVTADKSYHPSLRRIPDSLMGDAAACCYVSLESGSHQIIDVNNIVDGRAYLGSNSDKEDLNWFNTSYFFLIRQVIQQVLKRNNINFEDIKLIIGSNVNLQTYFKLAQLLDIPITKFYTKNIPLLGHLYCSDILLNLESAIGDKKLAPGDLYVTLTIGMGGAFGCALHSYSHENEREDEK
ncbi:3-oxoacyl-[acyl-carrier-protein] synthase III C-terminal domain-containing protein [Priestia koreensis]|uniref:3-oxoacyl-[acyl-carrier-protein] synthase III C-terminal domain-containing protein n=1 Tax=Priestia koreensis TaxID=284581 RepID=UPI003D04D7FE